MALIFSYSIAVLACATIISLTLPSALNWGRPPPIPALWPQRRAVFELLRPYAHLRAVEVGSGVWPILLRWPGAAEGVEISRGAWALSRAVAALTRSRTVFTRADALRDLPPAGSYVLYLGQPLTDTLVRRLAPGSVVVTVAFPVSDLKPLRTIRTWLGPVFLYVR